MAKYDTKTFISAWACISVSGDTGNTFDAINLVGRDAPLRINPPMRMVDAPLAGDMVIEFAGTVTWMDAADFHAAFEPAE